MGAHGEQQLHEHMLGPGFHQSGGWKRGRGGVYLFIFLGSSSSASSAALTALVFLSIAINQSDGGPTELGGDIPGLFPLPVSFPLPSFFLLPLTILFVVLFVVYHAFLRFLRLWFAPGFVRVQWATFTALGCGWG